MRTQNFIRPLNRSAPTALAPWTAKQISDEVICFLLAEKQKRRRCFEGPAGRGPCLLPPIRRRSGAETAPHRWGVVLAGGEGARLRELTRWVYGDDRPKQFCPLLGDRTLLEDTWRRAERSIPPEQILFCVTRSRQILRPA